MIHVKIETFGVSKKPKTSVLLFERVSCFQFPVFSVETTPTSIGPISENRLVNTHPNEYCKFLKHVTYW